MGHTAHGVVWAVIGCEGTLFAQVLGLVLSELGIMVKGRVSTEQEARLILRDSRPRLLFFDVSAPKLGGVPAGKRLLGEFPRTRVIAVRDKRHTAEELFGHGFHGCLSKDTPISRLATSVRSAVRGESLARAPKPSRVRRRSDEDAPSVGLTGRETEVLALLAVGSSNRDIAGRLHVTENTVRAHVQSIMAKLQVRTRLGASAEAARRGMTFSSTGSPASQGAPGR